MTRATKVADIRSSEGMTPGAVEFRALDGEVKGVAFRCPCGCGHESWLPIGRGERGWEWNGSEDAPTLTPSILQSGLPCKWHGFLTNGKFVSC